MIARQPALARRRRTGCRSARYRQILALCRRRGCSREDAVELVQEAHLRLFAYQRSTKVRDVDSLLRRIVINLSITHYHRERSGAPYAFERIDRLDRRGMLIDAAPSADRVADAERQLDAVASLLSAVSARTCQIFIAQRGGYSYGEIAAAFGVKPRTAEKHVATADSVLRGRVAAAEVEKLPSRSELG